MTKWVLVIAFHFFPAEGAYEASQMLNSRGLEDGLEEVKRSLEETLKRMKESLGADLQLRQNVILAGMTTNGRDFEEEVIINGVNCSKKSSFPTGGRADCIDCGFVGEKRPGGVFLWRRSRHLWGNDKGNARRGMA